MAVVWDGENRRRTHASMVTRVWSDRGDERASECGPRAVKGHRIPPHGIDGTARIPTACTRAQGSAVSLSLSLEQ